MEESKKKQNKFHLFKHHLHNEENDIKYRGPLSYRHLRIIAWVCMIFMALSILFSVFYKIKHLEGYDIAQQIFNFLGSLALPLFLIANFSFIMRNKKNLKKVILFYGLAALGMMFVAYAFLFRYYFTVMTRYKPDTFELAKDLLEMIINNNVNKYVFLNVFIDLFLCSLAFTFLTYQPKKYFQGKKVIIFRLFALLPVAYELACIYIKLHIITSDTFFIPWYIFPLLTTKPPMLLLGFLILTILLAIRKHLYIKKNNCGEDQYEKFLQTNANSLHFSFMTVAVLLLVVVLDLIVFSIVTNSIAMKTGYELEEVSKMVVKSGLGETVPVILIFPLIFLFSYSKEYKDNIIDKLIPVGGIGLCVLVVMETIVQFVATL